MSVFNSLGSNYTLKMASRSLIPAHRNSKQQLKQSLKQQYGAGSVYLTNKCREALALILGESGVAKGAKVAINGFTCYVVYEAVESAGLVPHLVDIAPGELNYSAKSLEEAIKANPDIKVAIVQNTLGIPSDIEAIQKVCINHGVFLIEDLPHSAGMHYKNGQLAGTVGDAAGLSFGMNKIIDAVTGGAAIFKASTETDKKLLPVGMWQRLAAYLYPLNTWVIRKTHSVVVGKLLLKLLKAVKLIPEPTAGYAGDLHAIPTHQAGLTLSYLEELPKVIAHRQKIAQIYRESLPAQNQFKHFDEAVYVRFPLRVSDRRALTQHLKNYNILLGLPWYEAVVAPERYMAKVNYKKGQCPEGEKVAREIVNLPTHINVTEEQAKFIAEKVNRWLKSQ